MRELLIYSRTVTREFILKNDGKKLVTSRRGRDYSSQLNWIYELNEGICSYHIKTKEDPWLGYMTC